MSLTFYFKMLLVLVCLVVMSGCSTESKGKELKLRSLSELINKDDPGWPRVQAWIKEAKNDVKVLPASEPDRSDALVATQVTTRSSMGAVVYDSGGLLVDHGWIRILGSGNAKLPRTLPAWNRTVTGKTPGAGMPFIFIADDVLGGFFALDGGELGKAGSVFYFAPDALKWQEVSPSYTEFLNFCFNGDLNKFYKDFRWKGWEVEVAELKGDQGLAVYPFLWAFGPPIGSRMRKPVPLSELYKLHVIEFPKQLAKMKPGDKLEMRVVK